MPTFDLYIETNTQSLVRGFTDSSRANLPAFVQGDSPSLRIWPLNRIAPSGASPYAFMGVAGLSFQVAIGTRVGNSTLYYTQQFTWVPDALNQSVTAQLPLNTGPITSLLDINSQAPAWFEVKYLSGGFPTVILQQQVQVQAAVIKPGALVVPTGSTVITAEDVNAGFLKKQNTGMILTNDSTGQKVFMYLDNAGAVRFDPVT